MITSLHTDQLPYLIGIPERPLTWLTIYGHDDEALSKGALNALNLSGYWAELTQSMKWVELRVWRLRSRKTIYNGEEVLVHPSMIPGGTDHSGPPDYVNREGYDIDIWAGTRLAAHAMLWLLQDGEPVS